MATAAAEIRPGKLTLFRVTDGGEFWHGTYLCEADAVRAARTRPGLFHLREIPTGLVLAEIDSREPVQPPRTTRRSK